MRDVAELAGVSARTVSNVVNGYVHVSPAMRARVQRALDELGYEMNAAARSLKSGRTGMIALVVPELHSPYFAELADAVVRAADRRELTVLIEVTEGMAERELRVLSGGRKHLTDGALLSPVALTRHADLPVRRDFPLVLLGESRVGDTFDHVGLDNVAATRVVVQHLVELGRTRIAALGADPLLPAAVVRQRAFEDAMAEHGLRPHPPLRTPSWERHVGAEVVDALVASGRERPDALFAFNDTLAIGALRALLHHGVSVPGEVAVASIDDVDEAAYATPPLTSIAPDLGALADTALAMLEVQLGSTRAGDPPPPPRQEWAPFRLVVRESTGGVPRPGRS